MPSPYVFYGLTAVRVLSIGALLFTLTTSILALLSDVRAVNRSQHDAHLSDGSCGYIANSTVPNEPAGAFWAILNRSFIIFQLIFLVFSEISWPMALFDNYFPVLGSQFSIVPLGFFQALIGATILSHHVDKLTLISAFFLASVGCLNFIVGLIFREQTKSKRSFRARRSGNDGALPMHTGDLDTPKFRPSLFGGQPADGDSSSGFGFGDQGEKQAGLKGFITTVPTQAAPQHMPRPPSVGSSFHSAGDPKATEPFPPMPPITSTFPSGPTPI